MRPLILLLAAACATSPPPLPTPTGSVHDFDYFEGAWTAHQRRLQTRTPGSTDWEEFPSSLCMRLYLDGMVTVDELRFPTKGWSGLTIRTFDVARKQWSIYWVSSRTGVMGPPQVGGFDGERGRFYGHDVDDGRPVQVLYEWTKLPPDRARWQQSFSRDGVTWQVNWTADFTRADPSSCPPARGAPQARSDDPS